MKILLTNALDRSMFLRNESVNASLGILYLASYARQHDFNDIVVPTRFSPEVLAKIKPDVVGISSVSKNWGIAVDMCWQVKHYDSNIKVVVGGQHISALPECLPVDADFGVIGEGEQSFLEILQGKSSEQIRGIVYREKTLRITEKRGFIEPLDRIPFPARDLVKIDGSDWVMMITSRGCPYHCVFCSSSKFWGKARYNSAEYVMAEIKSLHDTYGARRIALGDDLFIADRARLRKIVALYEQEHLDLSFVCTVRANLVDEELVGLLKRLNIERVCFGVESGSSRQLAYLKCGSVTVEQNAHALRLLKKAGFKVFVSIIVGSPTETVDDCRCTYNFLKDNPLDSFNICVFTPYPGSPVWDDSGLDAEGMDWSSFTQLRSLEQLDGSSNIARGMSVAELVMMYKRLDRLRKWKNVKYMLSLGLHSPTRIVHYVKKKKSGVVWE